MREHADGIAAVLGALELGEVKRDPVAGKDNWVPLSHFSNCLPFGGEVDNAYPDDYEVFLDATPDALGGWIDVSTANIAPSEDRIGFRRLRTSSPAQVRGRTTRIARHMIQAAAMTVDTVTMRATSSVEIYGWVNDSWERLSSGARQRRLGRGDDTRWEEHIMAPRFTQDAISAMLGLQFTADFFWHVSIGTPGGASLMLPTDPTALKEVFADREKVGARRPALRNWVREHWRQLRKTPELETRIRSHLRGQDVFMWDGHEVCILPSTEDLERLEGIRREPTPVRRLRDTAQTDEADS